MDKFLSCDWGTSFFRLRLVNFQTLEVIAEEKNDEGIAKTFALWNTQKNGERQAFYLSVIIKSLKILIAQLNLDLSSIPVIISGMAASNIGMLELPYREIPIPTDGSGLEIRSIITDSVKNQLLIISGIKSNDDVIRGEETKIVGCTSYLNDDEALILFTGTHPKHVTVKSKRVIAIKTYMTGEFFSLLTTHSILASSVISNDNFNEPGYQMSFKKGVEDSSNGNILHTAFKVRTNNVLQKMPKENNFSYLSGLLIGTELRDVLSKKHPAYLLCGGSDLIRYYKAAFDVLGVNVARQIDADNALLNGQKLIYARYLSGGI